MAERTEARSPSAAAGATLRLFAVMPADATKADPMACLQAFCQHADVASLLLPAASIASRDMLQAVTARAQASGIAVLVRDSVQHMKQLGADGLHVEAEDPQHITRLRRTLGKDVIIGACCPVQRHTAMVLGEAGADYLGIDQRTEARGDNLLAWWAQMFTVPVVAMHPAAPEELARLWRLGADFAVPLATMWQNAEQAAALGKAYGKCLQQIAQGRADDANSGIGDRLHEEG